MKPYRITAHVTTKYTVEVHAETGDDAQAQAEDFDHIGIGNAGEFEGFVKIEVTDVELLYPEDQDGENVGMERVPNAETLAAVEELESGGGEFVDLDSLKAPEGAEESGAGGEEETDVQED